MLVKVRNGDLLIEMLTCVEPDRFLQSSSHESIQFFICQLTIITIL